ncbi:hypothetical protein SAMN05421856_106209 [Chryseobacterium taichungense]|uniref:Uncharacterized protein n=1 Tax=Chryseobacterium taichungense TaxID=295069 RepID=A0A1H8B4K8_9FLAO|nr:hypothetical protein [Chryseobacterium taichungense]SEM77064.1 hypothetical protein SAMN05421856_106209 [Chryseobacterium taichungense]
MKRPVPIFAKPPRFPLFCVRRLFFVVFFISLSIKSETPLHDQDSVIFVSDGSFVFRLSQDGIYTGSQISSKRRVPGKQQYKAGPKVSAATNLPTACKNPVHKINPAMAFASLQCPQYIGSSANTLSTGILGNTQPKKHHKITGPVFTAFLAASLSKQKLQYFYYESFTLLKITIGHFSRPPPVVLNTNGTNGLEQITLIFSTTPSKIR